ncbi:hypothetical protein [Burkholderia sp. RF2-non_BP3]|uniref:hypothetical protein n=1 Tax=Burkholderia sp. RF2-non_BP3 TaxID=1637844 RepID=UPI0007534386|nr:hypothetical protein [Burkholderia sp. RF2-non_BP3]KUY52381.1 hypothetical protein WS45_25005 [Burkholderia sp. RF2-non_BP3]
MDPTEYLAGERAATEALGNIAADIAVPNELYVTFARLETDSARIGFLRRIQKHVERTRTAA